MSDGTPLTDRERRRRVLLLCESFIRNLAFYRAGQREIAQQLLSAEHHQASFWRQAHANFLDMTVIEWCKLFGDKKDARKIGKHRWSRVVSDSTAFESAILGNIGMSATEFDAYRLAIRDYRDKFVAHLDEDRIMDIPLLETAKQSVEFLYGYLLSHEVQVGDMSGFQADTIDKLMRGYDECLREAEDVFRAALAL